jgi:hypothetical protein
MPGQNQFPGQNQSGNPNPTGNPNQGVQGATGPVLGGVMPGGGVYGFPNGQPGAAGTGSPNDAMGAINNALRTPQQAQSGNLNALGAGGLAGVASTATGASIKIYKDRQKYNEWEFIFDLKQLLGPNGQLGLGQGGPNGRPGAPGQNGLGLPGQTGFPGQNGQTGQNGQPGQGSGTTFSPIFPTSGTPPSSTNHD